MKAYETAQAMEAAEQSAREQRMYTRYMRRKKGMGLPERPNATGAWEITMQPSVNSSRASATTVRK